MMVRLLIALLLASVVAAPVLAQQGQGESLSQADVERIRTEKKAWIALNRELAPGWKPLIERKPAPADADLWAKVKEKKHLLERG